MVAAKTREGSLGSIASWLTIRWSVNPRCDQVFPPSCDLYAIANRGCPLICGRPSEYRTSFESGWIAKNRWPCAKILGDWGQGGPRVQRTPCPARRRTHVDALRGGGVMLHHVDASAQIRLRPSPFNRPFVAAVHQNGLPKGVVRLCRIPLGFRKAPPPRQPLVRSQLFLAWIHVLPLRRKQPEAGPCGDQRQAPQPSLNVHATKVGAPANRTESLGLALVDLGLPMVKDLVEPA